MFGIPTLLQNYSWPLNYASGERKNVNMGYLKKSYDFFFDLI